MKESNYAEAAKTYDNNSVNVDVGVNENDWKDEKKMDKKSIVKEKFKEQLASTTGHGLGNIVGTDNLCLKIMWFVVWLIGVGFTLYLIISSLIGYFAWEVITKVRVINERPMIFPKVTFCNVDPFVTNDSITFLASVIDGDSFYKSVVTAAKLTDHLDQVNDIASKYASYFINNAQNKRLERDPTLNRPFGRTAAEFVVNCNFDNADCDITNDFQYHYSNQYGNCYTFNADGSNAFISGSSGKAKGLQVKIFIGKLEAYSTLMPNRGLKVFIGNHSTLYSEEEIIDVLPETEANIGIFKRITKTLEKPYSKCEIKGNEKVIATSNSRYYDVFKNADLTYRATDCLNYCYNKLVFDKCGCIDSSVIFHNLEALNVTSYCTLKKGSTDRKCMDNINANNGEVYKSHCSDPCPFECDSVSYTFSTSYTKYPTASEFATILTNPSAAYTIKLGTLDHVKSGFVKVNVYWNSLKYEEISEVAAMTVASLLGGLGGTLGLFLGFSILSIFEIFEFIVNCYTALKALKQAQNKVGQENMKSSAPSKISI